MPGFTSRDDIISEITVNGKVDQYNFYKIAPTASTNVAGTWQSLWSGVGNPGAASAVATSTPGVLYDSDTISAASSAIHFTNRSPDLKYLLSVGGVANQSCTMMVYDRLVAVGNISLTTTGSKTVNSTALLTRYNTATDALLNEAWLEITTASTTTAAVVNLSGYTTASGASATVGGNVTFPAAATTATTMIQLPLSPTLRGVRSVQTLNVTTATTACIANLVIIRPLARIPIVSGQWNEVSFLDDVSGIPRIYDEASLGVAVFVPATVTTTVWGTITCAYG